LFDFQFSVDLFSLIDHLNQLFLIKMTTIPNTNLHEEQMFLATLEECLQADNEKRTAAEVNIYNFSNLNFKKLVLSISKSIKIYPMKKKVFYLCRHYVIQQEMQQ